MTEEEINEMIKDYKPVKILLDELREKYGNKVIKVECNAIGLTINGVFDVYYPLKLYTTMSHYIPVE